MGYYNKVVEKVVCQQNVLASVSAHDENKVTDYFRLVNESLVRSDSIMNRFCKNNKLDELLLKRALKCNRYSGA